MNLELDRHCLMLMNDDALVCLTRPASSIMKLYNRCASRILMGGDFLWNVFPENPVRSGAARLRDSENPKSHSRRRYREIL